MATQRMEEGLRMEASGTRGAIKNLARKAGVGQSALEDFMNRKSRLTVKQAARLDAVLNPSEAGFGILDSQLPLASGVFLKHYAPQAGNCIYAMGNFGDAEAEREHIANAGLAAIENAVEEGVDYKRVIDPNNITPRVAVHLGKVYRRENVSISYLPKEKMPENLFCLIDEDALYNVTNRGGRSISFQFTGHMFVGPFFRYFDKYFRDQFNYATKDVRLFEEALYVRGQQAQMTAIDEVDTAN